jgi:peptidoglycan/LPS O-acetylase OafA/YrhL
MEMETWIGFPRWVELATRPGWMGVDLFFVLSGFLITGILLDSAGRPHYFRNFYGRRALRILPLYYLILLLISIFYRESRGFVGFSFFYMSNMAPIFGVAVVYTPLWSLSVEEHFYLLWPWLISRLKAHRIWLLAAGIWLAEPIFRGIAFFHAWDVSSYTWFRLDGLTAGALLATFVRSNLYSERRLLWLGSTCIAAAGILMAVGFPFGIYTRKALTGDALLYTVCSLMFAGGIAVVLSGEFRHLSGLMRSRLLRWCGDLSYCLYIVHWLIFYGWDSIIGKSPARVVAGCGRFGALCFRALGVCVICFALAELSRRFFEGPLLRLKRFFAYA